MGDGGQTRYLSLNVKATARSQAIFLGLGIVVGFTLAVAAAHQAAGYSKPSNFKRFHQFISPDTGFYPPFSMLENLALARWSPGQTVVIIGGNSIFNGVAQPAAVLWSDRLQALLGKSYVVVNLSFRGAYASEGAALVAESLLKRGIPTIYLANAAPGSMARPYESTYAYLFWSALAQDRLLPNPARERELNHRLNVLPPSITAGMKAKRLAAQLNHLLQFEALWHHVAYRHFSTVWSYVSRDRFWQARDQRPDHEPDAPPVEQRFRSQLELEMQITRGYAESLMEPNGSGGWRPLVAGDAQARLDIDEIFTAPLRARMVLVLVLNCPFYRVRLSAEEQSRDAAMYAAYEKIWRDQGVACITAGHEFGPEDYFDRTHLVGSGGAKLAQAVATEIRRFKSP